MRKPTTVLLDDETTEMLRTQSNELHLSHSALIRLLLIQNNKRQSSAFGG